jgi:iduronate 2-sulfatase
MKTSNRRQIGCSRRPILFALVFLLLCGLSATAQAKSAKELNVLFIVSDDLNNEVGIYGSIVKTPSLERLAAHSVKFDRAYCNYPVCNASRTSFLSGDVA